MRNNVTADMVAQYQPNFRLVMWREFKRDWDSTPMQFNRKFLMALFGGAAAWFAIIWAALKVAEAMHS